jgi:dolichol-phosphate mannosyltransferase
MPAVSIVIPVYNEAKVVEQTHAALRAVIDALPHTFEILYVDDGSSDRTEESLALIAAQDDRVIVLALSRNFGHQAALTAGLDHASGGIVISMDADGQHPADLIPQMINLIEQGYDIVQTQRVDDQNTAFFKRLTSAAFYELINRISGTRIAPGAADYRAMSRQALDALKDMPEYHRFLRGMVAWIGYSMVILPYPFVTRVAGKSKYSLDKMFRLASDAVFSFSLVPLYIGLSLGAVTLLLALAQMIHVLSFWFTGRQSELAPGWSSLMFVILTLGGLTMILLSFIGLYVGYIFQEVKHRPVYLLKKPRIKNE